MAVAGKAVVVVAFHPKHFPATLGFMVVGPAGVLRALKALGKIP